MVTRMTADAPRKWYRHAVTDIVGEYPVNVALACPALIEIDPAEAIDTPAEEAPVIEAPEKEKAK